MSIKIGENDKNPRNAWALTPEQSRAARAWLGWSQTMLAERAQVSLSTVRDFEMRHRTPIANNIAAIRRALEAGGILLLFDKDGLAAGIARRDAEINLGSPSAQSPSAADK